MTDLQLILLVIAGLLAFTQIVFAGLGIALMSRKDVKSVKISPVTGLLAGILFIVVILL
jgi:hypothetical protein